VFVRGRTLEGEAGLEVLWALRPDAGTPAVVVDRGFVPPSDRGASVLPSVDPAPQGEVTVTGWVRRGEASRGRQPARGQLASINVDEAATQLGLSDALPAYVLLESERTAGGSVPARLRPLGVPDRSLGPHLAYAYQWWLTMALGFVLVWLGVRREIRAENPETFPPRQRRTRIWEEEDG
jgi:cytochrome oxidase assembly protein ShyY1